MKVNAWKIKVMVLDGEEGLECVIYVDGAQLEQVELKYLGSVLEESGTDADKCCRKVRSGRKDSGTIRSWLILGVCSFSVRRCCMQHCIFLLYDGEIMIWREKKRFRIRAVQMESLKGLLGIKRMD